MTAKQENYIGDYARGITSQEKRAQVFGIIDMQGERRSRQSGLMGTGGAEFLTDPIALTVSHGQYFMESGLTGILTI